MNFLNENYKNSRHFTAELTRILEIPNYHILDSYKSSISRVIDFLKHLLQHEDLYLVNLDNIKYFEKQLLTDVISDELDLVNTEVENKKNDLLELTSETSKSEKGYCKLAGLKDIKFNSIKNENIRRLIIRLFLIAIEKNSAYCFITRKLDIKTTSFQIEGITYKSCNNRYLSHLFSLKDVFELYHKIMVTSSAQIFNQLNKSISIKESRDLELLKWYIENLHSLFSSASMQLLI